jgi:CheY-like chemotaxis protein
MATADTASVPGRRVLVVEDDATVRDLVARVLAAAGYAPAAAGDGAAALLLLHQDAAPAAILLDLGLPDMRGDEFVRRYRALPAPHAPIVVFTATDPAGASEEAKRLQAAGFVSKPFDLDTLLAIVDRLTA